jgi:hypothetical protein
MGNTRNTGYLQNIVQYDASNNITLPANLTVTGTIIGYATTSYVTTQISNLVNGAPGALDTLNELAAALGNDASFAATLTTSLSSKQASLNGTGFIKASGTTITYDNSTYALDSAVVKLTGTQTVGGTKTFTSQIITDIQVVSPAFKVQNSGNTSLYSMLLSYSSGVRIVGLPDKDGTIAMTSDIPTLSSLGGQPALSGTGFVKISGTTISYDNSTYLTTASASSTYLPLTGGTLTGRTSGIEIGVTRNGSDTIADGPWYRWTNASTDRQMLTQLNASNGLTTWSYNGTAWASVYTLSQSGAATFSNTLSVGSTIYANTGNEYLRNTAGAVNNAQFQTWFNSVGTRRGYFGYGSGGSNTLELNNESGGDVLFGGGSITANGSYFKMKGGGGSAEFIWYKDYSGSPSEPGFVINNRAGTTTFSHNANGGGTSVSGGFTAANLTASNSLYLPDGGRIIVNNETDIWGVRFRTTASTTQLGSSLKNIIYTGGGSSEGFAIQGSGYSTAFEVKNNGNTYVNGTLTSQGLITGNLSGNVTGTADKSGAIIGRSRGSFTVGGNTSTFYPVAFGIGSGSTSRQGIAVIQIERGGYDEPGYTGLGFSTFHCRIRAKADGWGYGASYVQVEANAYTIPMLADVTQQNQTSQLIVWLRGGCSYNWLDLEGEAGLNFGNPSGTTYVTFSGAVTYSSTATNYIGSNFKYQAGWGDNFISGKLTAATATFNLNASSILTLTSAGTNASMVKAGSGDELYLGGNDTWQMRFSGGNILMDNGGRVGIGTSSPEQALHVTDSGSDTVMKLGGGGAARDTNFSIFSQSAGNTVTAIHYNGQMSFYSGKFNIASSGSATLTGTLTQNSSDTRLKENIIPISNALSKIEQLTGFTYTWNQLANSLTGFNTSTQEVGLSAQSVQSVLPEAVFPAPFDNEFDPATQSYKSKSGENYLTVQYEKLVPLLVEAIKELTEKVNALENK